MKNPLSFFLSNHMYKGKLTYERIEKIILQYGFTLLEYDLSVNDGVTEILHLHDLVHHAEIESCFTFIIDEYHKYVFLRSGYTEKDKIYMLLHEAGHIYNEHFASKELVHNTRTKKERQANMFSSMLLVLNRICRVFPYIFASLLIVGAVLVVIPDRLPAPNNRSDIVYYTQSGEVYHLFEDCYHIRNSVIISGTVEASGKDHVCQTCEKRAEEE